MSATMNLEEQIESGYQALGTGEWQNARDAFESVLKVAEVPEAQFGLATALWWLGDMHGTMDGYERAYTGFRREEMLAEAAGAAMLLSFHWISHLANRAAAEGWLRRAERLVNENELDQMVGQVALFEGCLQEDAVAQEAYARQAVEHGRTLGDSDLELCALALLGYALIEQGRVDEGMPLLDETMAAALAGEAERLDTVVFASCRMMVSCAKCAAFERAASWIRASERFSERYGCPFLFAECKLVYGNVLFHTGRWEEAERELNAAIDLARDSIPAFFADATASLASLRLAQGRIEEAESMINGFASFTSAGAVIARIHLQRGQPELSAAVAGRYLDGIDRLQLDRVLLHEVLGEALLAKGQASAALGQGHRLVDAGAHGGCRMAVGRGERLIGRALILTDPERARRHLDCALVEFTNLDMPLEAALTCLSLAEALCDVQPDLAVSEARTALDTFERLGADRYADEVAATLRQLGVRGARSAPRTESSISSREEEVLTLLAAGLSNPEIAERLFISRKTVEHHVSSLLAKLDLRNRAEAAVEAVRRGLTPPS